MKFDLHTHHYRCRHAEGEIRDYIESAISNGLQIIGISDHSPFFAESFDHGWSMTKSEFTGYVEEVLRLKEEYKGRIEVLLGMESDYFPEHEDLYRSIYESHPFDYIIGSVHHSDGLSIFDKERFVTEGITEAEKIRQKEIYYDLIRRAAQSGMFQIMGHIDAMKSYYPAFTDINADAAVDETLKQIANNNIAVEINTSGKLKDTQSWFPSDNILERACYYGIDPTFGSDSHDPKRVGDDWELVAQHLKQIGFTQWVYFRNKQKHYLPL